VLLHGLVGAASAVLGGGNAAAGAIGSGASEAASQAMAQYLVDHNIDPNLPEGRALMALASTALGGAAGGDSGAAGALNGAKYNRELHVDEQAAIANLAATSNKKYTEEEVQAVACAMVKCVSGRGLTEPQSLADGLIGGSPTFTPAGQELINRYNSVLSGMSEEKKQEIKAQLEATGLFGYGFGEALSDSWVGRPRDDPYRRSREGFPGIHQRLRFCHCL
jgi:filamentous hemagglutinin